MRIIISTIFLLLTSYVHASGNLESLPDGIYYVRSGINPQKNEENNYYLSYRPESDSEVYFQVNHESITIYYYQSENYWIVGRAESRYDAKLGSIIINNIAETKHTPNEHMTITIGEKFLGTTVIQKSKEVIPISNISNTGFTISCDNYIRENKIAAFDFPEHYILSPEGNYCNRAYDDNGSLTHLKISVDKIITNPE